MLMKMGQTQECDSVKLDNGILVVHFLIIESPMVMQIYEQIIKHQYRFTSTQKDHTPS